MGGSSKPDYLYSGTWTRTPIELDSVSADLYSELSYIRWYKSCDNTIYL